MSNAEYNFANPSVKALFDRVIASDMMNLGHIDTDLIFFLNKEEKKPKKVLQISQIKEPYIMLTDKLYIVEISEQLAGEISLEHLELYVYHWLRRICPETGRIRMPDVVEFHDILVKFGHDWKTKEIIPSVIDMLNGKINIDNIVLVDKDDEDIDDVEEDQNNPIN